MKPPAALTANRLKIQSELPNPLPCEAGFDLMTCLRNENPSRGGVGAIKRVQSLRVRVYLRLVAPVLLRVRVYFPQVAAPVSLQLAALLQPLFPVYQRVSVQAQRWFPAYFQVSLQPVFSLPQP